MNSPEIMIDLLWTLMNIYHAINPSKPQRIAYIPWNAIIRNNAIETTKQAPVWDERLYIKLGGGLCTKVKYSLNQLWLRWHRRSQRSPHTPFGQCDLWLGKADINVAMSRTAALPTHPYTYSSMLSSSEMLELCPCLFFLTMLGNSANCWSLVNYDRPEAHQGCFWRQGNGT